MGVGRREQQGGGKTRKRAYRDVQAQDQNVVRPQRTKRTHRRGPNSGALRGNGAEYGRNVAEVDGEMEHDGVSGAVDGEAGGPAKGLRYGSRESHDPDIELRAAGSTSREAGASQSGGTAVHEYSDERSYGDCEPATLDEALSEVQGSPERESSLSSGISDQSPTSSQFLTEEEYAVTEVDRGSVHDDTAIRGQIDPVTARPNLRGWKAEQEVELARPHKATVLGRATRLVREKDCAQKLELARKLEESSVDKTTISPHIRNGLIPSGASFPLPTALRREQRTRSRRRKTHRTMAVTFFTKSRKWALRKAVDFALNVPYGALAFGAAVGGLLALAVAIVGAYKVVKGGIRVYLAARHYLTVAAGGVSSASGVTVRFQREVTQYAIEHSGHHVPMPGVGPMLDADETPDLNFTRRLTPAQPASAPSTSVSTKPTQTTMALSITTAPSIPTSAEIQWRIEQENPDNVVRTRHLAKSRCSHSKCIKLMCGCAPCCGLRFDLLLALQRYVYDDATASSIEANGVVAPDTPQQPHMAMSQPAPLARRIAVGEMRQVNYQTGPTRMASSLPPGPTVDLARLPPGVVGGRLYAQVDGTTRTASPFMSHMTGATVQQARSHRMEFEGRAIVFEWKDFRAEQIELMIMEANRLILEHFFLVRNDVVNNYGRQIEAQVHEAQSIGDGEWYPRVLYNLCHHMPASSTPGPRGSQC
ncbi:hypothetical protein LTR85_004450 [Meristemomyces frigidus]|nr:hypothetical protein LTR85_004450 [Meristemomyces frigidus]